jgi:hypothetical protein
MTAGIAYGFFKSPCGAEIVGKALREMRKGMLNGMKLEPDPNIPGALGMELYQLARIRRGAGIEPVARSPGIGSPPVQDRLRISFDDGDLVHRGRDLASKGANYFMRATLPDTTNESTTKELGVVMNILYSGCIIVGKTDDDPNPIVEIFREKNGVYVSARLYPPAD